MSQVYQQGSIRKTAKRNNGIAMWEWRYRVAGVQKSESFSAVEFRTEKALRQHLARRVELLNAHETAPKIEPSPLVTLGTVATMYRREYLAKLSRNTQNIEGSMLSCHIEPKWQDVLIDDVTPKAVSNWVQSLSLSASSKGRIVRIIKQLIDKAIFEELIPDRQNPMRLVRVKGSTKRQKEITLLSPEQVNALIAALEIPYGLMVLTAASLGLRISEVVALKWTDFDTTKRQVTIARCFTRGEVKATKTESSAASLPVSDVLRDALDSYRSGDSEWVFPSPVNDGPRWGNTVLEDYIRPACKTLGLPPVGWHSFRHSYASWMSGGSAPLKTQKDAMRHSKIEMTLKYGGTQVETMRPFVDEVAGRLHSGW